MCPYMDTLHPEPYEADVLDLVELKERSERVRQRIGRAKKELQDAEKRLNDTMELQSVMNRLEDFAAQIDSRLDELSWEEQRQVIRVLVARVEMDEEGAPETA